MVTAIPSFPHTTDKPIGDLTLRFCGDDQPELRLRSRKCTVGAGPQCTLRLRAPAVEPIHCLIVRGGERTVIRNWSQTTRHNGQRFDDATLTVGDRLSFGPWEFEVVDLGYAAAPMAPVESRDVGLASTDIELDRERQSLETQRRQVADQATALEDQLFELHRQTVQLQQQREQLAADQQAWRTECGQRENAATEWDARAEELRREQAQLQAEVDALQRQQQRLEQQQLRDREAGFGDETPAAALESPADCPAESELEAAEQRAQLDRQAAILLEQVQLFEAQRDAWETHCQSVRAEQELAQRRLVERAEEIERHAEELRERQATVNAREVAEVESSPAFTADRPVERRKLDRRANDLARQQAELAGQREEFQRQYDEWQRQREEAETKSAGPSSDAQVTVVADVGEAEELRARLCAELQAAEDSRRQAQSLLSAELSRLSDRERDLQMLSMELDRRQEELDRREAPATTNLAEPVETGNAAATDLDQAQWAERTQQLDQRDLELEALRQQLDEQRRQTDAQAEQINQEKTQLLKQTMAFQQRQAELEAEATALQKQRAELEEFVRQSHETAASATHSTESAADRRSSYDDLPSLLGQTPAGDATTEEAEVITPVATTTFAEGRLLALLHDSSPAAAATEGSDAAVESPTAEPQAEQKEDLRDILRRLGKLPNEDNEPAPVAAPHPPRTPAPQPKPPAARTSAAHHDDHEDDHDAAVQAYMAKLLNRDGAVPVVASASNSQKPEASAAAPRSAAVERTERKQEPTIQSLREYTRVAAPEKQADLNAFREVANQSAEAALGSFRRRKAVFAVAETLFMAVSAGIGANFIILYDPFGPTLSIYASLACALLMAVMIGRTVVLTGRLRKMNGGRSLPVPPRLQDLLGGAAPAPVQHVAEAPRPTAPAAQVEPAPVAESPSIPLASPSPPASSLANALAQIGGKRPDGE